MAIFLRVILLIATLLYPFGVYYALQYFDARYLVFVLLFMLLTRLFSLGRSPINHWAWIPLIALLAVWTWQSNSALGVKLYPVLISSSLLLLFLWSLKHPPSMVERLARINEPNLPAAAIPYTRKVTVVWCVFFAVNGLIALGTGLCASNQLWALYNGFIAYICMGLIFAVEWLVRQRYKAAHNVGRS